jgi:flagellar L-ring protein precursor FlgH
MIKPFSLLSKSWVAGAIALLAVAGPAAAQSLWKDSTARCMFADKRACKVGDILTIIVAENNTASKGNTTQTSKKSSINDSISSFFYSPAASGLLTKAGQLPSLQLGADHEFTGGGTINNSEQITSQIAVRVVDALPNGNLVIEGRKQTSFSGETQDAIIRGVVRTEDIAANNTTYSYNVADASIRIMSKGVVTTSQKKGWFTSIFDKVSPF